MNDHRTSMILQSIVWGLIFGTFIVLFIAMIFDTPETTEEKFKVVDNYKDCQVIQYTVTNVARYQYFLHCP